MNQKAREKKEGKEKGEGGAIEERSRRWHVLLTVI